MNKCTECGRALGPIIHPGGLGAGTCRGNAEEVVIASERETHYVHGLSGLLADIACNLRRIAPLSEPNVRGPFIRRVPGRRAEPSK